MRLCRINQIEGINGIGTKIGQIFSGVISGVSQWGFYVEVNENKCEGMVPLREIDSDFYYYDEDNFCIIGKHTGRKFQVGDDVDVEVTKANLARRQLDFRLA